MDGQGTKRRRKIAEIYNHLSRVHERYRQTDRQTDDRETDGRQHVQFAKNPTKPIVQQATLEFVNFAQTVYFHTKYGTAILGMLFIGGVK